MLPKHSNDSGGGGSRNLEREGESCAIFSTKIQYLPYFSKLRVHQIKRQGALAPSPQSSYLI